MTPIARCQTIGHTLTIRFYIALVIYDPSFRALAEISSLIRETCTLEGTSVPRSLFSTCRALFSIVKDTRLSIRHGEGVSVGMALGIGQDRRGVHAPVGIDTGCYPPTMVGRLIYTFKVARRSEIV